MYRLSNYLLLALFSLLLLIPGIASLPVLDRDEAHFAQASRQMLQTNQYFQIRFQDKTRFQKPPGINWLQAASVRLFSNPDASVIWPYRLPSTLGALISVLLLYFFSRRFIPENAARLGAGLLASSLLLVVEAHMAVIDASLLSSVILMQGALWIIYQEGTSQKTPHWCWSWCFWLAMTYGFVLKGVTPLVGFLTIFVLCFFQKPSSWLRYLRAGWGISLFLSLSFLWLYLVNQAEGANYLLQMIHKDLLPKLKGGHESHGHLLFYHLLILPLTFWPASLFLWQSGVYAIRHRQEKAVQFLIAWFLPTWIFFEIMPTKLPQYVLPAFPALALISALAVTSYTSAVKVSAILRFLQALWFILSFILALLFVFFPLWFMQELSMVGVVIGSSVGILTGLAAYFVWQNNYRFAAYTVFFLAIASYPLAFHAWLPHLNSLWVTPNLVNALDKSAISADKPLLVVGYEEPSLVFQLNTHAVAFVDESKAVTSLLMDLQQVAVVEPKTWIQWASVGLNFPVVAQIRGFNYSKGRWLDLLVIQQNQG